MNVYLVWEISDEPYGTPGTCLVGVFASMEAAVAEVQFLALKEKENTFASVEMQEDLAGFNVEYTNSEMTLDVYIEERPVRE